MAFHKLSRGIKNEPVKETLEETFAKAGLGAGWKTAKKRKSSLR